MTITNFIHKYLLKIDPINTKLETDLFQGEITDEMVSHLQLTSIFKNAKLRKFNVKDGEPRSFILEEDMEFSGEIAIKSIILGTENYDADANPGPSGVFIKHINDPYSFTSYKKIVMGLPTIFPDIDNFALVEGEGLLRKMAHEQLDKALDNPENYAYPSYRKVLIQAVFGPKNESHPEKHYKFYTHKINTKNN